MGSFNIMCNVSNAVIRRGDKVAIVVIGKNRRQSTENMVIYNTESYIPLSLPFIAEYEDYGQFTLPQDEAAKRQNAIAWSLFKPLTTEKNPLGGAFGFYPYTAESQEELVGFGKRDLTGDDDKDMLDFFNTYITKETEQFSLMVVDYNIYEKLTTDIRQSPVTQEVWELGDTTNANLDDYVYDFVKEVFDDSFPVYDGASRSAYEALSLIRTTSGLLADTVKVPLHVVLFDRHRRPDPTLADAIFYQQLAQAVRGESQAISVFIDAYCFSQALMHLNVPYGVKRVGSQSDNDTYLLQSVLGTIRTLKQRVAQDYIDGNILALEPYLNKPEDQLRELSETAITELLDDVSLSQLEDIVNDNPYE